MNTEIAVVIMLGILSVVLMYRIITMRESLQLQQEMDIYALHDKNTNEYKDFIAPENDFIKSLNIKPVKTNNIKLNTSKPKPLCGDSFSSTNIKDNYLLLDRPIKDPRLLIRPRLPYEIMYGNFPSLNPTKPIFI